MNVNGVHLRSVQFSSWIWLIFLVNWNDREWTWLIFLVNWKLSSHKEGNIWLKLSITISFSPKNLFFYPYFHKKVFHFIFYSYLSLKNFLQWTDREWSWLIFLSLKSSWLWVIVAQILSKWSWVIVAHEKYELSYLCSRRLYYRKILTYVFTLGV